MSDHGWRFLFGRGQRVRGRLRAALLTTYDRPDERFLVERLLPDLLAIDPSFEGEPRERAAFYGRLATKLEALSGRIAVVSSMSSPDGGVARAYPWLWRYVHQLHVGCRAPAVQHAKLWLLHWEDDESEQLELCISSANLTQAAARDQIQACWRAVVDIGTASKARLASWGVLPSFLTSLAESAGAGEQLSEHFRALLARAEPPSGVTFLASVPGSHGRETLRRTPWGRSGLHGVALANGATRIAVSAPYVGTWSREQLSAWCAALGTTTKKLQLVWIDREHPWSVRADGAHWRLPAATLNALSDERCTLLRLEPDTQFHPNHRGAHDARWSHAKLYHLRRSHSERLILTSANFSRAAWGDTRGERLHIENFELGVCLDQHAWPLEGLSEFEDMSDVCTVATDPMPAESAVLWADASWDGREVSVACRVREGVKPHVELRSAVGATTSADAWRAREGLLHAFVPWESLDPPVLAVIEAQGEYYELGIRDLRSFEEMQRSPLPEIDPADSELLREQLLLEEFGHYTLEGDDPIPNAGDDDDAERSEGDERLVADYSVAVFEDARAYFDMVDEWARRVHRAHRAGEDESYRRYLRVQGDALTNVLRRRAEREGHAPSALPARLSAEELAWRVDAERVALEDGDG